MSAVTWVVTYQCGCTHTAPTPNDLDETCPLHGTNPTHQPELVTGPQPDPNPAPVDADVCGRCEGQGQILVTDLYGPAWAICHSCAGLGVRRAVA